MLTNSLLLSLFFAFECLQADMSFQMEHAFIFTSAYRNNSSIILQKSIIQLGQLLRTSDALDKLDVANKRKFQGTGKPIVLCLFLSFSRHKRIALRDEIGCGEKIRVDSVFYNIALSSYYYRRRNRDEKWIKNCYLKSVDTFTFCSTLFSITWLKDRQRWRHLTYKLPYIYWLVLRRLYE